MIFLKHFDTTRQSLFGIGKIHVPRVCKVRHLIPSINAKMRWAPGTPLRLYEVEYNRFFYQRDVLIWYPFPRNSNLA